MIEIQNVSKSFGRKRAVDRLSLTVKAGEVFAFLGPNGAGKTTTIKMIVGLLRPSEGRILVCGHDVAARDVEAKALLSYVPDQPYLYEKLTGREFLQFIADIYRMPKHEAADADRGSIATYELEDFVDQLTGELLSRHEAANSGGRGVSPRAQGRRHRRADGGARPEELAHRQGHASGQGARGRDGIHVDAHAQHRGGDSGQGRQ